MAMTRKDYVKAAKIVAKIARETGGMSAIQAQSAFLALFADESNFDSKRFIQACGVAVTLLDESKREASAA